MQHKKYTEDWRKDYDIVRPHNALGGLARKDSCNEPESPKVCLVLTLGKGNFMEKHQIKKPIYTFFITGSPLSTPKKVGRVSKVKEKCI